MTRTFNVYKEKALLDLSSYARHGPERIDHVSPAQIEQIARTVRRVPEVMIKVSGGSTSPKGVATHFHYIDRHGALEIETDEGERRQGNSTATDLTDDWDLEADAAESRAPYTGQPGRKPSKLVHNVILSMPAGTPPAGLLAASRAFAREQFAFQHRYAMVLHTDQDHPHVHLVVKAMSQHGERLNMRKATLREWRSEFACHLREHGIAANATERAVRGESKTHKRDGIYRAMRRGESTHLRARVDAVAKDLRDGTFRTEPGKTTLLDTRKEVERGWQAVRYLLASQGQHALATQVSRFVGQLPSAKTERERLAEQLLDHVRTRARNRTDAYLNTHNPTTQRVEDHAILSHRSR